MSRMTGRPAVVSNGGALAADATFDLRLWLVPALILGAVLPCIAALVLVTPPWATAPSTHPLALRHGLQSHLSLPATLVPAASATIGASQPSFWAVRHSALLSTQGGGIHSTFNASGAALRVAHGTLDLSLIDEGSAQHPDSEAAVAPSGAANEILYREGSVSEFYRNGPYGLEQGFTVLRPQAGSGSLVLALGIGGSLVPEQVGSQILFKAGSGATALRYGQLSAMDATGRHLPAQIRLHNGVLQLVIGTRGARYPLRIDPFIQQGGKLTGSGEADGRFGESVALSADGDTALIGGCPPEAGAAWVFTRSGSTWTEQTKLTGAGDIGFVGFGCSVALSADGNTALIGGGGANEGVGAAWVFARSGSIWTEQAKLTGAGEIGEGFFGESVGLSADGNTALIGGSDDNDNVGAAWVFTRLGSMWTEQAKLTGAGEINGGFGVSVALSENGNTALIGSSSDNGDTGAAWVFARSGSVWSQQGGKLPCPEQVGNCFFGWSVALSSEGNTALVGAYGDYDGAGAAWVFARSGSTWTEQAKLTDSGHSGLADFGSGVALSAEGNTALIGGFADDDSVGAAWVFTRSGSTWSQQGAKLTGTGEVGPEEGEEGAHGEPAALFGRSVALSSDATTALIGGIYDDGAVGAAWVFENAVTPPSVVAGTASSLTETSAALIGTVNPNRGAVSDCHFEYGVTQAYGTSVPCASLPGSGENPVAVSAAVASLSPQTTYHYRLVATNTAGTTYGHDHAFTTVAGTKSSTTTEPSVPAEAVVGLLTAEASGGTGTITVGRYASDPAQTHMLGGAGLYIDSYLTPGDTFASVELTDCELGGASTLYWWNPQVDGWEGEWEAVSDETEPSGSPPCITATFTEATTPSLAQLTGTVFVPLAKGPPPTVTKLSAKKGSASGGTSVTITGTDFMDATRVEFGSTRADSYTINSATSITAISPEGTTGLAPVSVTTPGGTSGATSKAKFTFESPTVTGMSPTAGKRAGDTLVTVTGSGFTPGTGLTAFKFGKTLATSVECSSTTTCTMFSPAAVKKGTVDVRATSGGKTSKKTPADRYSYD